MAGSRLSGGVGRRRDGTAVTALASIMRSPLLVRSCRVLVGLIMLAAALSKIGDAGSFAR